MRRSAIATACALLLSAAPLVAQSVQAIRSIGRAESEVAADSISRLVGELTGQVATLRTLRTRALRDTSSSAAPLAIGLEQLELLAQQAIERRDDLRAFVRAVTAYRSALKSFVEGIARVPTESGKPTATATASIQALDIAQQRSTIPPQIHQYVQNVLFALGLGVVGRPAGGERNTIPFTVSTNLVGQVGGGIVAAVGAGELANYFKDNVVVGVAFEGRIGKPSGQLTAGLGEVKLGRLTFWPVLGFDQADSSDTRVPRSLSTLRPTVGTWSTPMIATAFTWLPLDKIIARIKAEQVTPIFTVGLRFPYYYPGSTTDALGALFSNKLSNYARTGRLQFVLSVDVPLLKVDPSRLLKP